jgi:4-amino-4-deoxy-L-arabinose transferase-like glycosyltransferase
MAAEPRMQKMKTFPRLLPYALLAAFCLLVYLPGLSTIPPLDRDESRYVQASRQMLESGDFVTIRFQESERNKKPVMIHWLQSGLVSLLSDPQADDLVPYRLVSVAGATTAVLLTFGLGQTLVGRAGAFMGALVLAGCTILATEAHIAKTDAALLASVAATMGLLGRAYLHGRDDHRPPFGLLPALTFWIAAAIGTLIKGPLPLLFAGFAVVMLLIADRKQEGLSRWLVSLRPLWGIPLYLLIVLPWFIAVSRQTHGQFIAQAWQGDILPKLFSGQESHGKPPGFYVALAVIGLWPGSLFLVTGLCWLWRRRDEPAARFLLAWAIPTWAMFELIATKLPHYVLPAYPALALAVGGGIAEASASGQVVAARLWSLLWGLACLVFAAAVILAFYHLGLEATVPAWTAAGLALVMAPIGCALFWTRRPQQAFVAGVAGGGLLFALLFSTVLPALRPIWVARNLQEMLAAEGLDGRPVISVGFNEPSLVFLLGTGTVLGGAGDVVAAWQGAEPDAIALVEGRQAAGFASALRAAGLSADEVSRLPGVNYSNGRHVEIALMRRGNGGA